MTERSLPPGLARRLLRWTLPEDVRADICGDLHEVFLTRRRESGWVRAGLWYWGQAMSFSARFLHERLAAHVRGERQLGVRGLLSGGRMSGMSWLDFKLGARMLVKYPGLTVVGGLAMAIAIAFSAGFFEFSGQLTNPTLPFEDGHEIVALQNWDVTTRDGQPGVLSDFVVWRDQLTTVQDVGAAATAQRNLFAADGRSLPVRGVSISASAFRVTRVPPLLGRALVDGDESVSAPPVVVIGYDIWIRYFGGDPGVLGRSIRFGAGRHTVVGVMPEDFKFPINEDLWLPLRFNPLDYPDGEGPSLLVFGRLSPGSSLREARAEFTGLGERLGAGSSTNREHLRPQVIRYSALASEGVAPVVYIGRSLLLMFLMVACANVGTLIFARSATRESEIAVRAALGAGRSRIIWQLFVEALLLAAFSAALGLGVAAWGLSIADDLVTRLLPGQLPFWWSFSLSPRTVVYVGLLTVFSAALAGALPALKVTRQGMRQGLRHATTGGSGLRFGGLSTAIIVTQVALSIGFLAWSALAIEKFAWSAEDEARLSFDGYLSVRTEMTSIESAVGARTEQSRREMMARYHEARRLLAERLEAEPGVVGVTFGDKLPGQEFSHRRVEVQGMEPAPGQRAGRSVSMGVVDPNFFEMFGAPIVKGRTFTPEESWAAPAESDPQDDAPGVVVVNESFVATVLHGEEPLGLFVRFGARFEEASGRWYQIVGVAGNLGMDPFRRDEVPGVYHPVTPSTGFLYAAVDVGFDPLAFTPRLRRIGAESAPSLLLDEIRPVGAVTDIWRLMRRWGIGAISAATSITLLLSVSGIYALMSFIVAQRTREIGIRTVLGAHRHQIVLQIFSRALLQLGIGVLVGLVFLGVLSSGETALRSVRLLAPIAGAMVAIGILACGLPTWRALRIQPREALRDG